MTLNAGEVTDLIQIAVVGLILVLMAQFVWKLGGFLLDKIFKKVDEEYLTVTRFLELCNQKQASCAVVKDFATRMEGLTKAIQILIVHTIEDKDEQERALQALK